MSVAQMRPTFLLDTGLSAEEVMSCIKRGLETCPEDFHGQFTRQHAMISIDESKRHFWSPWMHIEVRDANEVREVFGRFSPHPSIWTGFMFSYLSIVVLIFFSLMLGISQQMTGLVPWGYYLIPGWLLVAGILWLVSKVGQNLARDEMQLMKESVESCLAKRPQVAQ
ncbi:MAG: hypothetical protein ACR2NP_09800 [Pirellulaceae bacterium]